MLSREPRDVQQRIDRTRQLTRDGWSCRHIAEILGLSERQVLRYRTGKVQGIEQTFDYIWRQRGRFAVRPRATRHETQNQLVG